MIEKIQIKVEDNFCERSTRKLIIKTKNAKIETEEFDSKSDRALELAIQLQKAAIQLLWHHDLNL